AEALAARKAYRIIVRKLFDENLTAKYAYAHASSPILLERPSCMRRYGMEGLSTISLVLSAKATTQLRWSDQSHISGPYRSDSARYLRSGPAVGDCCRSGRSGVY